MLTLALALRAVPDALADPTIGSAVGESLMPDSAPPVVVFEDVPLPADAIEPAFAAYTGVQDPLEYELWVLAHRPADPPTLTLISSKQACEVPVRENVIVRVRAASQYLDKTDRGVRLARVIDATACPGGMWLFGVIGSNVSYEPFTAATIGIVPDEVASLAPVPSSPKSGAIGGVLVGDTWVAWSFDGDPFLVRNGHPVAFAEPLDDAWGALSYDGRSFLIGNTGRSWGIFAAELVGDPVTPTAYHAFEPFTNESQRVVDEGNARYLAGLEHERRVRVAVGLAAVPVVSVLGAGLAAAIALVGLGRAHTVQGAIYGALAAPLAVYSTAAGFGWALVTLIGVFVWGMSGSKGSGFLGASHPDPALFAWLAFGVIGMLCSCVILVALLGGVPRSKRSSALPSLAALGVGLVAALVQHLVWFVAAGPMADSDGTFAGLGLGPGLAVAVGVAVALGIVGLAVRSEVDTWSPE